MANTHPRNETLRAYAAGTLTPGLALLVATHLGFCRCCRGKVAGLEALCGALLANADPVPPTRRCLTRTLARLDACDRAPAESPISDTVLPAPLRRHAGPFSALAWTEDGDGLAAAPLTGFPSEQVSLIRASSGACLSPPATANIDALLVLTGSLSTGGTLYNQGDVALDCCGRATAAAPCLCLLVQRQP